MTIDDSDFDNTRTIEITLTKDNLEKVSTYLDLYKRFKNIDKWSDEFVLYYKNKKRNSCLTNPKKRALGLFLFLGGFFFRHTANNLKWYPMVNPFFFGTTFAQPVKVPVRNPWMWFFGTFVVARL